MAVSTRVTACLLCCCCQVQQLLPSQVLDWPVLCDRVFNNFCYLNQLKTRL